jgi:tRNA (adenine37-N6)-methyltransferase
MRRFPSSGKALAQWAPKEMVFVVGSRAARASKFSTIELQCCGLEAAVPNDEERRRPSVPGLEPVQLAPVGIVRSGIPEPGDDCWAGSVALIELDPLRFSAESTCGLDEFSHVEVLFLFNRVPEDRVFQGARHPRDRKDWPLVGIFAQRAKDRPNRIGVTVCRLERVEGTRIWVQELDAVEGTPVLDIKPYMAEFGPRGGVQQPDWSKELMAGYFRANR